MDNKPVEEPKPEYVLVNDMTGKPPKKRGPQIINAYGHDIKLPRPPNEKCKKCYGRGYIGREAKTELVILCHKCFPNNK